MFNVRCDCQTAIALSPAQFGQPVKCPECGREIVCISAEALDDSAAADFDAALLVVAGPSRETLLIALGGWVAINVGSDSGNPIVLADGNVAPIHGKLVRIDANPSVWQIEAVDSSNLLVNGQKVATHELQQGDTIEIGEYELRYQLAHAVEKPLTRDADEGKARPGASAEAGPICPSCRRRLVPGAQICVDCGIRLSTGRPLQSSLEFDENTIHGKVETAAKILSWFLWVTPLPIPLASALAGKFRPYATWTLAALTLAASISFLIARWQDDPRGSDALMLWPMHPNHAKVIDQKLIEWEKSGQTRTRTMKDGTPYSITDEERRAELVKEIPQGEFHPWQLITYALVNNRTSVIAFLFQLGGSVLFLIVLGSRINAIIGNIATFVLYPLLAIASASIYVLTAPSGFAQPLTGASSAIGGLAGLYLVLLPAPQVYCALWFRNPFALLFTASGANPFQVALKVFALRGFWIVLVCAAYIAAIVAMEGQGLPAIWAHAGGFAAGIAGGFVLLLSRKVNCHSGDLLSLLLGKYAWPLIGSPSRWAEPT